MCKFDVVDNPNILFFDIKGSKINPYTLTVIEGTNTHGRQLVMSIKYISNGSCYYVEQLKLYSRHSYFHKRNY